MAILKRSQSPSAHGVVSTGGERMAAGDPRRAHPADSEPTVLVDRLVRVVRAGRVVAAGGRQNLGQRELVTANQQQEKLRHGLKLASLNAASAASAFRSAIDTSSAARPAIRAPSIPISPL